MSMRDGRMKGAKRILVTTSLAALIGTAVETSQARQAPQTPPPNFVIILADDLGYADIHLTGNPVIRTPHIDQLARDGLQLTSLYTAPLCTPTRGELLTGRYPVRTGLIRVTGPADPQGIRPDEVTLANALKPRGYRTAMFGKWHIGDFDTDPTFNPTAHGFDLFVGLPYSHDYNPPAGVPLYRNTTKIEQPVNSRLLTQRYTEEAIQFIRGARDQPFFVYLAHNMPHVPVGTSDAFVGRSRAGRYGDAVEEVDWSVGQIVDTLRQLGLDRRTVLVFQSDNGPWESAAEQRYDRGPERGVKVEGEIGWPGLLRGSKGTTFEGGVRVPAIVGWPGTIPAGSISADIVSVMDWFPTFVSLAGGRIAPDHPVDGLDISGFLKGRVPDPRHEILLFRGAQLEAVRQDSWKLRVGPPEPPFPAPPGTPGATAAPPAPTPGQPAPTVTQLFNVDVDPAERFNVASEHPEIVQRLKVRMGEFEQAVASAR